MPPRTIVYIDGFNLYYGAVRGSAFKWLNLQRFFQLLPSSGLPRPAPDTSATQQRLADCAS